MEKHDIAKQAGYETVKIHVGGQASEALLAEHAGSVISLYRKILSDIRKAHELTWNEVEEAIREADDVIEKGTGKSNQALFLEALKEEKVADRVHDLLIHVITWQEVAKDAEYIENQEQLTPELVDQFFESGVYLLLKEVEIEVLERLFEASHEGVLGKENKGELGVELSNKELYLRAIRSLKASREATLSEGKLGMLISGLKSLLQSILQRK